MTLFAGLSAFPVTPTDAEGRVDCGLLARLTDNLLVDGVTSIGVLGSTGGYMYLSTAERERALRAAVEAAGSMPILAGIGDMRTSDVLTHAKNAEQAGASGLLLAPVSYLPLMDEEVTRLAEDVASATPLPICFYNNPGTTKFSLSEEQLVQLATASTIAAVKNPPAPAGDFAGQISRLRELTPSNFSLGYSGDASIAGALEAGADAWYSVLAGTLPKLAAELWSARNDAVKLASLNENLSPLWKTFDAYGSIRVVHEITGMIGLGDVRLPRPLLPFNDKARHEIEHALTSIGVTENNS